MPTTISAYCIPKPNARIGRQLFKRHTATQIRQIIFHAVQIHRLSHVGIHLELVLIDQSPTAQTESAAKRMNIHQRTVRQPLHVRIDGALVRQHRRSCRHTIDAKPEPKIVAGSHRRFQPQP